MRGGGGSNPFQINFGATKDTYISIFVVSVIIGMNE